MENPRNSLDNRSMIAFVLVACGWSTLVGCHGSNSPESTLATGGGGPWDGNLQPGWHYEGIIADNHGHQATVNAGQILRDEPLHWNIQSQADHPHWLELSVYQLHQLEALERVDVLSATTNDHAHWVRYN